MATAGALDLEGGAAGGAALQLITQALAQLQEATRREWQGALRQVQQEADRRLREAKGEMEAKVERLEGDVEALKRRLSLYEERGSVGGGAGQGPVELLQGRMAALEVSLKRALESVLPRVSRLVDHLEARPVPESHPSPTVSSAASVPAAASASSASTSTCAPVPSQLSASKQQPRSTSTAFAFTARGRYSVSISGRLSQPPASNASAPIADPPLRHTLGEKLMEAACKGKLQEAEQLLDGGGDPNYSDDAGRTPLMAASRTGHSPVVSLLLRRGADVRAADPMGWTALHNAAAYDHSGRCVKPLLAAGAEIDRRGYWGWTPLHSAAVNSNEESLVALLNAGACKTLPNDEGKTPQDVASRDYLRYLLRHSPQSTARTPRTKPIKRLSDLINSVLK